jgi:hypothetical protein
MATTFETLKEFMNESGLQYDSHDEHNLIAVGFGCEPTETTYRDADGDPHVQLIVRLVEDGEFVVVVAPQAWNLAACDHKQSVCEVIARAQAKLKLARFDLDENFLNPNIEIPLEKAPMCCEQLMRAIAGVLLAVRRFDPVIRHAMETGIVDLELAHEEPIGPADNIGQILELGDAAGGLDVITRLLGDSNAPPLDL